MSGVDGGVIAEDYYAVIRLRGNRRNVVARAIDFLNGVWERGKPVIIGFFFIPKRCGRQGLFLGYQHRSRRMAS